VQSRLFSVRFRCSEKIPQTKLQGKGEKANKQQTEEHQRQQRDIIIRLHLPNVKAKKKILILANLQPADMRSF
jgi:hypothetical protein